MCAYRASLILVLVSYLDNSLRPFLNLKMAVLEWLALIVSIFS